MVILVVGPLHVFVLLKQGSCIIIYINLIMVLLIIVDLLHTIFLFFFVITDYYPGC